VRLRALCVRAASPAPPAPWHLAHCSLIAAFGASAEVERNPPTGGDAELKKAVAVVNLATAREAQGGAVERLRLASLAHASACDRLSVVEVEAKVAYALQLESREKEHAEKATALALAATKRKRGVEKVSRQEQAKKRREDNAAELAQEKSAREARERALLEATTIKVGDYRVEVTIILSDGNSFLGTKVGCAGEQHLSGDTFSVLAPATVAAKPAGVPGQLAVNASGVLNRVVEVTAAEVVCVGPSGERLSYSRNAAAVPVSFAWKMASSAHADSIAGAKAMMPGPAHRARSTQKSTEPSLRPSRKHDAKPYSRRKKSPGAAAIVERVRADSKSGVCRDDLEVREGKVWCKVCRKFLPGEDKSRALEHLRTRKHAEKRASDANMAKWTASLVAQQRATAQATDAVGQATDDATLTYRMRWVAAAMKAHTGMQVLETFRHVAEAYAKNGEKLTSAPHLSELIPAIATRVIADVAYDPAVFHVDAASYCTDATSLNTHEYLNVVARVMTKVRTRLRRLVWLILSLEWAHSLGISSAQTGLFTGQFVA
jgi:hypothetical protein